MPVTMRDIARDLGVSIVTVSKALREHPDISRETRERVLERVKTLKYRPNLTARSLVTGRSSLIGLIVPDLIHPFFAEVAKGLSYALRREGYFVVMASSEEDPELERQEIDHMLAHRLDALVVASCQADGADLAALKEQGTPLILVDRAYAGFDCHFVGNDDYAVARLATEHLIAQGCKKIAMVRGPENSVGVRRLKGFLDTLKKHGRPQPDGYIFPSRAVDVAGQQHGANVLDRIAEAKLTVDGIFCHNDAIAIGLMTRAAERGIRVPQEMAVIGCGNLYYDELLRVPLSSVDQRSGEIGGRTAKLVLRILAGLEETPKRIALEPRLVARESTRLGR